MPKAEAKTNIKVFWYYSLLMTSTEVYFFCSFLTDDYR